MSTLLSPFVQVAIPSPLHQLFDYRWPAGTPVVPGVRVTVPFGRRSVVAVVVRGLARSDVPTAKLRAVSKIHDDTALLPADILALLDWAARYYHHPPGEVLSAAVPVLLRRGAAATIEERSRFRAADGAELEAVRRAPVQRAILQCLLDAAPNMAEAGELAAVNPRWRTAMRGLIERGLAVEERDARIPHNESSEQPLPLMPEQTAAVAAIGVALGSFRPFLLNGVTGSGKTEVYLQAIDLALAAGSQVLVLVPEISLTPQLMRRFARRVSGCLVSLHSGLNDTERTQNWLLAARGHADVVIGTRSAVLVPLPRLGLVVVDEEHDTSLKQQDGFRYHARDLALMRARDIPCPVVLGTATPSFESLNNVALARYSELPLTTRAGEARPPTLTLLDIRRRPLIEGMSDRLLDAMAEHLAAGGQALVFINRRGFAPTLLCNDCGACADCLRCDAHMTVHAARRRLRCHHCGADRPVPDTCGECGSERLDRVGYGTERIAAALSERFPDVTVARIDRDSTRRKGALQTQLEAATSGAARLLVGTQMLAKGHHFPGVTLVGILDADRGLFGTDFRSLENMGQLIVQVAGRAGRESRPGTVMVQTRNPDNPMLQTLVSDGYAAFADVCLADRKLAQLPPYTFAALVRAEAVSAQAPTDFLLDVAERLQTTPVAGLHIMGPAPAPMERLGGRYRAQLLVQADRRADLNACLAQLTRYLDSLPAARKTRWSIDVDPVDFF